MRTRFTTWAVVCLSVGCAAAEPADRSIGGLTESSIEAAADTFLKQGSPNQPQGDETFLRIRSSGHNRALVRIDHADVVAAVGDATLVSATLELTILDTGENWGSGRTIDLHRLTSAWTEPGATWNCADDADPADSSPDCDGPTEWEMGTAGPAPYAAAPTDSALILGGETGVLELDVTADVLDFLAGTHANQGWLLRKTAEGQSGWISFVSREGGSAPRLRLELEPSGCVGPVAFASPSLEARVRALLGIPSGPIDATDVAGVVVLSVRNAGIADLGGLECFESLGNLDAAGNPITSLAPLAGLTNLFAIDVSGNAGIADLSPLAASTGLRIVNVSAATAGGITDLSPLAGMTELRSLAIDNHQVADLAPLAGLTELLTFSAHRNRIASIGPLAGKPGLYVVVMDWNVPGISDLSPLAGAPLWQLSVPVVSGGGLTDLSPLAGSTTLEGLNITGHQVSDLTPLAGVSSLLTFSASGNRIASLAGLEGKPGLYSVLLSNNLPGVDDLSPLGSAPLYYLEVNAQTVAGRLSDLSPLASRTTLRFLHLAGQPVSDTSPLAGHCQLAQLDVIHGAYTCPDAVLASLASCGVTVVDDCP